MNLRRFHALIEVADRRSFSDAANALRLTQPAISKQIKSLEDELGVTFFLRDAASVQLTEAGVKAYQTGKRLLHEYQGLVEYCQCMQDVVRGRLRVGASTIPGTYLLPQVLYEFRMNYPHVELNVTVASSGHIVQRLLQGSVDLAVVGSEPSHEELSAMPIGTDELVLIGPRDISRMNIASFEKERLEDFFSALACGLDQQKLQALPMIGRERTSGTQTSLESTLRKIGIDPTSLHVIAHVEDTSTLVAMVAAGIGFGVVSARAANRRDLAIYYRFKEPRMLYLLTAKRQSPDAIAHRFIEQLKAIQIDHEGDGE
ncbi:selenium metabolism-associated LysR family transcriptional regulator [Ferroacidibacillus organovorans]|uniref:HTH lysR-type domain-containing protein n=1 Tax=Ferroacidibacillus organovorans TaxID=1765683 RepID=A0A101XRP9_9BACL|nr:selenium metabolism-associated LysR family transcriptional regulator [Ferroacidibacillus organovorans]KUO96310.1 hypothetical protein ATW55_03625 [Ferroacidibacillus organovorans]